MRAYLIAEIEVHDPALYDQYVTRVKPVVEAHGGSYVVRGGPTVSLAGGWEPERVIVVGFPSKGALQDWLGSPEYAALAPLRERSCTSRAIIVEGWEA